jgi:hypothetical protein
MRIDLLLTAYADGDNVGVMYGDNPVELPAGYGPTLSAALRNLADEIEKYGCDITAKDFESAEHLKTKCHASQERTLGREPQPKLVWFGNKPVQSLEGHEKPKKDDAS